MSSWKNYDYSQAQQKRYDVMHQQQESPHRQLQPSSRPDVESRRPADSDTSGEAASFDWLAAAIIVFIALALMIFGAAIAIITGGFRTIG